MRCEFVVGGHRELSEVDGDSIDVRDGSEGVGCVGVVDCNAARVARLKLLPCAGLGKGRRCIMVALHHGGVVKWMGQSVVIREE